MRQPLVTGGLGVRVTCTHVSMVLPTGFLHPEYAASLAEFGAPRALTGSSAWLLERQIDGSPHRDAIGCYPLFCCSDWTRLEEDLAALQGVLVSVAVVTDPFGRYDQGLLERCFPELVVPFKQHFVVDLSIYARETLDRKTRQAINRGLRQVRVERCAEPWPHMDDWVRLYGEAAARFAMSPIQAMSRRAFERQFRIPGLHMWRAVIGTETVAIATVFVHGDTAYGHLIALSEVAYRISAGYAIYATMLDDMRAHVGWFNLGGAPGATEAKQAGIGDFKRQWATGTRTAYLCGRILDSRAYRLLSEARALPGLGYFPAYRAGEFR